MNTLSENEFSTRLIAEATDTEPPKSRLFILNEPVGAFLAGAILEACIKYKECYLVFMTDDIPFEDTLRVYLLDKGFSVLDYATLSSPYSTGSFHLQEIREPNTVVFQFFGGTSWAVELLPEKQFFIPFFSEPRGVSRKLGYSRYFKISGHPLPESD